MVQVAGKKGMVMKTGGTVNFEEDDDKPARYEWSIVSKTNANMIQNSLV
jgi:transcription elongation GreA/GreB family factor